MANLFAPLGKLAWSILTDTKNHLYALPLSKDTRFKMWDRPGEWCTDE